MPDGGTTSLNHYGIRVYGDSDLISRPRMFRVPYSGTLQVGVEAERRRREPLSFDFTGRGVGSTRCGTPWNAASLP